MISIVTACMDRKHVLDIVLPSWLTNKHVQQVVVVDWSSATPIHYKHPKIKVVRKTGETHFNQSRAFNLGMRRADHTQILKLDADVMLNPNTNYFDLNILKPGEFITGTHELGKLKDPHGFFRPLNGMVHMWKHNFIQTGGYNESFSDHGYDDEDLYNRLKQYDLKRTVLDNTTCCMFHVPHGDNLRVSNYKIKNIEQSHRKNFYRASGSRPVKNKLDRTLCINLKDRPEYYEPFKQLNLPIDQFEAVDSRENKHAYKDFDLRLSPGSLSQQLYFSESPGAVGCFLSHYKAWTQIVNRQTPLTLVLEDDADATQAGDFIQNFDYMYTHHKMYKYDLVQLNKRLDCINFDGDFNGTESYLITLAGARKLMSLVNHRPAFNNVVRDWPPCSIMQQWDMFMNEPPQDWNAHERCIVAAVDKFIGMSSYGDYLYPNKLTIGHVPCINRVKRTSTVYNASETMLGVPFYECKSELEMNKLLKSPMFKWWEQTTEQND